MISPNHHFLQYQDLQTKILPLIKDLKLIQQIKSWQLDQPLDQIPIRILFSGQWNAGKSSLINALLGQKQLLPTAALPETARMTNIVYGPEVKYYQSLDQLNQHQSISKQEAFQGIRDFNYTDEIWIQTPNQTFDQAIITDMPGSNAPIEAHQQLLLSNDIPKAQLLIYVISALAPIQNMDIIHLKYLQLLIPTENIFLVFSRSAGLEDDEKKEIIGRMNQLIPGFHERYFFVDSLLSLKNSNHSLTEQCIIEDESGIVYLKKYLKEILAESRVKLIINSNHLKLKYLAQQQYLLLEQTLRSYQSLQRKDLNDLRQAKQDLIELNDQIYEKENILMHIFKKIESQGYLELKAKLEKSKDYLNHKYQAVKDQHLDISIFQKEVMIYFQNLYQQHCEAIYQILNQETENSELKIKIDTFIKDNHQLDQIMKENLIDTNYHNHKKQASIFDYIQPILFYIGPFLPNQMHLLIPLINLFQKLNDIQTQNKHQDHSYFDRVYEQIYSQYSEILEQFTNWFEKISREQLIALDKNTSQALILKRGAIEVMIQDLQSNQQHTQKNVIQLLTDLNQLKKYC